MPGLIVIALVGLAAQLVDGSLGMGYGVTSTTFLLAAGLSPAVASAAVHLAEVGTNLVAGISHWRFGNVDWVVVRRIALPGAVGAFIGGVVLSSLTTEAARPWMAALLLVLGVYVIARFAAGWRLKPESAPVGRGYLGVLGLTAGFVDATGGGGWGPVATPTLLASGRMEPRKVIGSVDASEFLVSVAASLGFLLGLGAADIPFDAVLALLIGGVIAAPAAAWLVRHAPAHLLGVIVGGMILFTNTRTMLGHFDVDLRWPAYAGLAGAWLGVLTVTLRQHRRIALEVGS